MAEFLIGATVHCADGPCGEIRRVVVDPVAQKVTDLVVEAPHREGLGKLVPLDMIDSVDDSTGEVLLKASLSEVERLAPAEETLFQPGQSSYADYPPGQAYLWPLFGLSNANLTLPVTEDLLPRGQVEVKPGETVHATDGEIGKARGLVVDSRDGRISHVLLQEGHLWGKKQVAVPITAVAKVDEGIRLRLSKKEVEDLPPVEIDLPA